MSTVEFMGELNHTWPGSCWRDMGDMPKRMRRPACTVASGCGAAGVTAGVLGLVELWLSERRSRCAACSASSNTPKARSARTGEVSSTSAASGEVSGEEACNGPGAGCNDGVAAASLWPRKMAVGRSSCCLAFSASAAAAEPGRMVFKTWLSPKGLRPPAAQASEPVGAMACRRGPRRGRRGFSCARDAGLGVP